MIRIGFLVCGMVLLHGCYFANQCGVSPYLYDDKTSFFDSQGAYHEVCPTSNVFNYDDIKARYGAHNPYVYDDLFTPVPSDSPRGQQAMQREFAEFLPPLMPCVSASSACSRSHSANSRCIACCPRGESEGTGVKRSS